MSKRKPATSRGLRASPMIVVAAVALIAAAIGLAAFWLIVWNSGEPNRADAANPTLVARGEVLYQQHCASCHGANLEGQPNWRERDENGMLPAPPHDMTGHTWHHSDALLFDVTKWGSTAVVGDDYMSNMPGLPRLCPMEISGPCSPTSRARGRRISRRSNPIWRIPVASSSTCHTSDTTIWLLERPSLVGCASGRLLMAFGKSCVTRRGTACRASTLS